LNKAAEKFKSRGTKEAIEQAVKAQANKLKTSGKMPELIKNKANFDRWMLAAVIGGGVSMVSGFGILLLTGSFVAVGTSVASGIVFAAGTAGLDINQSKFNAKKKAIDKANVRKMISDSDVKKQVSKEFLNQTIDFINKIGKETANRYMGSVK
jgi:hypothetical protein